MRRFREFLVMGGWEGEPREYRDPEWFEKHARFTKLNHSHLDHSFASGMAHAHKEAGHKLHTEHVPIHKLRATQEWVEKGYKGSKTGHGKTIKREHENEYGSMHPTGLQDKHGNVHLVDGHHRADEAARKKRKSLKVSYFKHHDMPADD